LVPAKTSCNISSSLIRARVGFSASNRAVFAWLRAAAVQRYLTSIGIASDAVHGTYISKS
jgi:hypothetical protein